MKCLHGMQLCNTVNLAWQSDSLIESSCMSHYYDATAAPGLQVGLATDVAGGYSPSMLSAMRHAVTNAKAVRMLRIDRERTAAAAAAASDQAHSEDFAAPERPACSSPAACDGAAGSSPVPVQITDRVQHAPTDGQTGQSDEREGAEQHAQHNSTCTDRRLPPAAECLSIDGPDSRECLDYKGAFWLATMGSAEALGLQVW
jgi:hypothetical protein